MSVSGTQRRWLLPALIVLAVLSLFFIGSKLGLRANAQTQPQAAANDRILVISVQFGRDSYGIAMVDTLGQTMWVYKLNSRGPAHNRLELLAARSWRYDRLLQQYNTARPKPEDVKMLLENLSQQQKKSNSERQQDSDINALEKIEPNDSNLGD